MATYDLLGTDGLLEANQELEERTLQLQFREAEIAELTQRVNSAENMIPQYMQWITMIKVEV